MVVVVAKWHMDGPRPSFCCSPLVEKKGFRFEMDVRQHLHKPCSKQTAVPHGSGDQCNFLQVSEFRHSQSWQLFASWRFIRNWQLITKVQARLSHSVVPRGGVFPISPYLSIPYRFPYRIHIGFPYKSFPLPIPTCPCWEMMSRRGTWACICDMLSEHRLT